VKAALERADGVRGGSARAAGPVADQLEAVAKQVEADAESATTRDAVRLRALASTMKERAGKLR
jgi:hypothetical protein